MLDVRRLFGRNVSGELNDDAIAMMMTELQDAEASPLIRKFALWALEGRSLEDCWHLAVEEGSEMQQQTAGWYMARAYRFLRETFGSRWREFGLQPVHKAEGAQTTIELAELMGIAPATLRGKMDKARQLGFPMPERMLGRTLRRGQYIFPELIAQEWLDAYMDGVL